MNDRKAEIEVIMGIIHNICVENKIGLIPYKTKSGKWIVAIQDATNGKNYAIINKTKGDKDE